VVIDGILGEIKTDYQKYYNIPLKDTAENQVLINMSKAIGINSEGIREI